jgi:hypothetical protein
LIGEEDGVSEFGEAVDFPLGAFHGGASERGCGRKGDFVEEAEEVGDPEDAVCGFGVSRQEVGDLAGRLEELAGEGFDFVVGGHGSLCSRFFVGARRNA